MITQQGGRAEQLMRERLMVVHGAIAWLLGASVLISAACVGNEEERASDTQPTPEPIPSPSAPLSADHPVQYFNLSEEDALSYLSSLNHRALEALHDGDLDALHDIYTSDGPAGRKAAATIMREFRQRLVDRTEFEVISTQVLKIRSQMAVFRQVRLVYPCVWTYDDRHDVTPDDRVVRQVLIRYMADERLNWRLHRDIVRAEKPTGDRVTACP